MLAIRAIPDLRTHDHLCLVYDRDTDVRHAVLGYAVAGLARRERVLVYSLPGAATATIEDDLRTSGLPVDDLVASGRLVFGSAEEAYLSDGVFDAGRRLDAYADAARSATADGLTGVRAYVETQFLLDRPEALAAWPGYEMRADLLIKHLPMTAVCAYDARRWTPGNLTLVETVHARRSRDGTTFSLHATRDGTMLLAGDIDYFAANQVYRLLVRTAPSRPSAVLDVSGLRFVDVSAARSIGAACEAIAGRHGPTWLRGAAPLLRTIWEPATWSDFFPNAILED